MADALIVGRAALSTGAWQDARASFEQALSEEETPEALEGLSWAAWWLDDVEACLAARERAYRLYRSAADVRGAARMALWLGDDHLEFRGEEAVANGWFGRTARLLEGVEASPEHGWLDAFEAHTALLGHDTVGAKRLATRARELGRRLGVVDLEMFALAVEGRALVIEGEVDAGMRCLDEAAAAALGGEFDELLPAGWTCCQVIHACEGVRDYDRAAQWCKKVEEFTRRMGIRFVNGACRAYYAGVLCWHGSWREAEQELLDAAADLTATRPFWLGEALVRLGELRRRQGRYAEARELFSQTEWHPLARLGLAELALDEGDVATARDLAERMLRNAQAATRTARAHPLELIVRVHAVAGEHESAAARLAELRSIADDVGTAPLRAAASFCEGVVAAAAGEHEPARTRFEDAVELFAASGAPFELGRARLELATVLSHLGRDDPAKREATAALRRFGEIGATAESARARALLDRIGGRPQRAGPLTTREVEVLHLVAEGLSDRGIATKLTLSEHTVHRHVANIHSKLGCSSRAAAVAQANRLGLL